MNNFELLTTWLTAHVKVIYRFLGGLTVSVILAIPALFMFGETLVSFIGHILSVFGHGMHILFEVFEWVVAHILEEIFHLSKRTAEIIFFWSCLAGAIGLSWYFSRKARIAARHAVSSTKQKRLAITQLSRIKTWIRMTLIVGSLNATLYVLA